MALGLRKALAGVAGAAAAVGVVALTRGRAITSRWRSDETPDPDTIPLPVPLPPDPERLYVAERPQHLTRRGWFEVVQVIYADIGRDRLFLIAAGVAFFALLSIFPAVSALVSVYGLFADAKTIVDQMGELAFILPPGAVDIVRGQAEAIAGGSSRSLSVLAIVSLLIALWSANAGMKSMFDAMNLIYGEDEKRSFLQLNLQSFFFTLGGLGIFVATIVILLVVPFLLSFVELQDKFSSGFRILRWPALFVVTAVFLTLLNRYGPSRMPEAARWAIWGSVFGAGAWIAMSILFSYYLGHFGNYAATYGSLATIAGLMMWLWLSALVVLIGIELNAELEKRTSRWESEREYAAATQEAMRRRQELMGSRKATKKEK